MADVTPEQVALYALARGFPRSDLPMAAQLEYDRLRPSWERGEFSDRGPSPGLEPALQSQIQAGDQPRSSAVRHTVDRSGTTHTYRLHRGRHVIVGIFAGALGAALLTFMVLLPIFDGSQWSAWDEILTIALGLFFTWGAICAFRRGVQASGEKLLIHNELFTRKVDAGDIRRITLKPKAISQVGTHWVAQVELTSGGSIWIDDFDCGSTSKPPNPEQAAIVEQVRALLGVRTDDAEQAEPAGLHRTPERDGPASRSDAQAGSPRGHAPSR